MTPRVPSPMTPEALGPLARRLVGRLVNAVGYFWHQIEDDDPYAGGEFGYDWDIATVELELDGRETLLVTWSTVSDRGSDDWEGLIVVPPGPSLPHVGQARLDASARPAWRDVVGQPITELGGARVLWDRATRREFVWALRLGAGDTSVVVALGGFGPGYELDELVVVHDRAVAAGLRPEHAVTDAWGETV